MPEPWEALIGVGLGAYLALVGLALAAMAHRIPPNPVIGMRVGYAYASRDTWVRANRAAGLALAALGVLVAATSLCLGLQEALAVVAAGIPVTIIGLVEYTRRLAEHASITQPPSPSEQYEPLEHTPWAPPLLYAAAAAALTLTAHACLALTEAGLSTAAAVLAAMAILAAYTAYLGANRPEALVVPGLGRTVEEKAPIIAPLILQATIALTAALVLAATQPSTHPATTTAAAATTAAIIGAIQTKALRKRREIT